MYLLNMPNSLLQIAWLLIFDYIDMYLYHLHASLVLTCFLCCQLFFLLSASRILTRMSQPLRQFLQMGMCIGNVAHEYIPVNCHHWEGLEQEEVHQDRITHYFMHIELCTYKLPITFPTLKWAEHLSHFSYEQWLLPFCEDASAYK